MKLCDRRCEHGHYRVTNSTETISAGRITAAVVAGAENRSTGFCASLTAGEATAWRFLCHPQSGYIVDTISSAAAAQQRATTSSGQNFGSHAPDCRLPAISRRTALLSILVCLSACGCNAFIRLVFPTEQFLSGYRAASVDRFLALGCGRLARLVSLNPYRKGALPHPAWREERNRNHNPRIPHPSH